MLIFIAALAIASSPECNDKMSGDFSHVELFGHFATDAGCVADGYSVDGEKVASRGESAKALKSAGWAHPDKRVKLAVGWAKVAGGGQLLDGHQDTLNPDGSVTVLGWIRYPVGMRPERVKIHVKMVFAVDGSLTQSTLDRVVEPL